MTTKTNELNAAARACLVAEWEPQGAVLMAWPHADTDWAYMLDEVQACYMDMLAAIAPHAPVILLAPEPAELAGRVPENVAVVQCATNDTWIRDYGPLSVRGVDGKLLLRDFCFNGWGMKFAANHDNMATRRLVADGVLSADTYVCDCDMVLEGGSVESDGRGTLLTTACCLLAPNRNEPWSRERIECELKARLGVSKVLWLEHGQLAGDDTDGHIDTLCRLAPNDTIVYTGCSDPADEHYGELRLMADELRQLTTASGHPFRLIELPLPAPLLDPDDGTRLPATYANYLVANGAVIVPTYANQSLDTQALAAIRSAFPGYEVKGVDCRALVRQHGSLHCATMQISKELLTI